jgi:hypothetical protein
MAMAMDMAANLFLACYTLDISWKLGKVACALPESKARFEGYASALRSLSTMFIFLAYTINDLSTYPGHELRQRYLDSCAHFVGIFDLLHQRLQACSRRPSLPLQFKVFGRTIRPLEAESFGEFEFYLRQIETNTLLALRSASAFFVDYETWRRDWPLVLHEWVLPKFRLSLLILIQRKALLKGTRKPNNPPTGRLATFAWLALSLA